MRSGSEELVGNIERFYRLDVNNECPVHIAAAVIAPDKWGKKRVVSGRGLTEQDAARRCLFEAIERQSAVYNELFEILQLSTLELGGDAVNPHLLLQISDDQYLGRTDWNNQVEDVHRLPTRFDTGQSLSWIKAKNLITNAVKYAPAAHCFLGYPNALEDGFPIPDSSGLASGDCLEDAVERGLLELIERDAVSIWWYNTLDMPALELSRGRLDFWKPYTDWIARCERQFWLLDLTTELSVPVAAAISCDQYGSDLSFGFGAALTPEKAAEHAMCEMVQFEVTKKLHRQPSSGHYPHFLSWCKSASTKTSPFLLPKPPLPGCRRAIPFQGKTIVDQLQSMGFDTYVVDFSGLSQHSKAVRVLVPGLRQIWPRFAAGRLYDVPHALGLIKRPLGEAELNPIPILY